MFYNITIYVDIILSKYWYKKSDINDIPNSIYCTWTSGNSSNHRNILADYEWASSLDRQTLMKSVVLRLTKIMNNPHENHVELVLKWIFYRNNWIIANYVIA